VLHRGEQRRLGERLRRLRLSLGQCRTALRDRRDEDPVGEVDRDDVARGLVGVILVFLRGGMLDGVPSGRDGLVGTAGEATFAFGQKAAFVRMPFGDLRLSSSMPSASAS